MAGISSISDIFRKDDDGEYIKSNAKLAQKILSYILVNQKGESSQIMSKLSMIVI